MVYEIGDEPLMPENVVSINGSLEETLARFQIREICEGFPCHRDACEWTKFRNLFAARDAYVWTTWSGALPVEDFIKVSTEGFKKGVFIMHKCLGCIVDLSTHHQRAVGKLKAIITQRFTLPKQGGGECVVDVECQCRLCFFVEREEGTEDWKIRYFKGFYEKDKMIPIDPRHIPELDDKRLTSFPENYRYLAYAQSFANPILKDLPTRSGPDFEKHYANIVAWLAGEDISERIGVPRK